MSGEGGVAEFACRARDWLHSVTTLKPVDTGETVWGEGSDSVSVFHDLTHEEEQRLLLDAMAWQGRKFGAGYGAITWPRELGGGGLAAEYERAFRAVEAEFVTPPSHETFSVTISLVAPTVRIYGTAEQQDRFIGPFLRGEHLCCQLFSEPQAGSDLASLQTRAVRDGDDWVVNGQKVWSSGAQFSAFGELIARTEPNAPKHAGLTAFMLPMDTPGVTVRPIRQMSGGSSFNEVFLDDVRIPDRLRLGPVGEGWRVALTTLGFERAGSGGSRGVGGSWERLLGVARHFEATGDPVVRQRLAQVYTHQRIRSFVGKRVEQRAASGEAPGAEGSIGKLLWTRSMTEISEVVSGILGPRLIADTGEWGTWAWREHLLGAPGYKIAGGSDEVQHNILAERILGLPRDPRPATGDR